MTKDTLTTLLKTHHREAYLWSLQCCYGNQDNAKDVLQLVYLKIVEGKATYKEQSLFKTWLFSVIRFTAIDYHKKQQKLIPLDGIIVAYDTKEEPTYQNYRQLIQKLPERQQQILTLAFYHDMTLAQIAEIKQLHIGTVRTHYERGKTALRQLINSIAI